MGGGQTRSVTNRNFTDETHITRAMTGEMRWKTKGTEPCLCRKGDRCWQQTEGSPDGVERLLISRGRGF